MVFKIVKSISTANFCLFYSVFRIRNHVGIAPPGIQQCQCQLNFSKMLLYYTYLVQYNLEPIILTYLLK
jgi:hypothetical protein